LREPGRALNRQAENRSSARKLCKSAADIRGIAPRETRRYTPFPQPPFSA
jgi:hypothetical protein